MANIALKVGWTRWDRLERELFAEWGPRGHWIQRQDD